MGLMNIIALAVVGVVLYLIFASKNRRNSQIRARNTRGNYNNATGDSSSIEYNNDFADNNLTDSTESNHYSSHNNHDSNGANNSSHHNHDSSGSSHSSHHSYDTSYNDSSSYSDSSSDSGSSSSSSDY